MVQPESCIIMMIILYIGTVWIIIIHIMIRQQQAADMQWWLLDGMIIFLGTILAENQNHLMMAHGWSGIVGECIAIIFGCLMRLLHWQILPGYLIFQKMMDLITIISVMVDWMYILLDIQRFLMYTQFQREQALYQKAWRLFLFRVHLLLMLDIRLKSIQI